MFMLHCAIIIILRKICRRIITVVSLSTIFLCCLCLRLRRSGRILRDVPHPPHPFPYYEAAFQLLSISEPLPICQWMCLWRASFLLVVPHCLPITPSPTTSGLTPLTWSGWMYNGYMRMSQVDFSVHAPPFGPPQSFSGDRGRWGRGERGGIYFSCPPTNHLTPPSPPPFL